VKNSWAGCKTINNQSIKYIGLVWFVCFFVLQFFSYLAVVTITGDRAANFSLCSALRAFEQGGIFIVPHLLRHGTSVYRSHPKDRHLRPTVGFAPPTQGSSDHCARRSNHCATQAGLVWTLYVVGFRWNRDFKKYVTSCILQSYLRILKCSKKGPCFKTSQWRNVT
jgi:hypothetical protein